MKVLWLTPSFWPERGGIETFGWHLARDLQSRGHDLLIVTNARTLAAPAEEVVEGLRILRMPFHKALAEHSPQQLLTVQRMLALFSHEFQPEVLHLHLVGPTPMAFFALRLQKNCGTPLLVTIHDDARGLLTDQDTLLGQCLRASGWLTADSQTFLTDVLQIAPDMRKRASVIPPGVPPLTAVTPPIRLGATQFLAVGRMIKDKGMDLAVAALAHVAKVCPAARLVLAGEGPELDSLRSQVVSLRLEQHVHFAGSVTDAERTRLIDASLALLMPSRHREGFGIVALEAAQRGRAVIAARAGALIETVSQLSNGLLVPQEDVPALATAMIHLLMHPAEARRLGEAGRHQAGQRFGQEMCTTSYLILYDNLLSPVGNSQ